VAEGGGEEQATSAHVGTCDAFISYASQDAAIANALCNALERGGVACWLAPRNVRPGDFYADAIVQAITQCRVLILVLSQAAIDSPHVLREVERASSKKRAIITFRTDTAPLPPGLEYFLSASQWLDASGGPPARQFSKLVDAIRSRDTSAANIGPIPSKIAGIRSGRNRIAPLLGAMVLGAVALVYFAADKHWFSNRFAGDDAKPAPANPAAAVAKPRATRSNIRAATALHRSIAVCEHERRRHARVFFGRSYGGTSRFTFTLE
jgi:TIR domain-containing protein